MFYSVPIIYIQSVPIVKIIVSIVAGIEHFFAFMTIMTISIKAS